MFANLEIRREIKKLEKKWEIKELEEKIARLELKERIVKLEDKPAGLYYKVEFRNWRAFTRKRWIEFRKSEVKDEVNGNIKIGNEWHKKEDVILYEKSYEKEKKEIEKRLK